MATKPMPKPISRKPTGSSADVPGPVVVDGRQTASLQGAGLDRTGQRPSSYFVVQGSVFAGPPKTIRGSEFRFSGLQPLPPEWH